jgi:hypothetical protein
MNISRSICHETRKRKYRVGDKIQETEVRSGSEVRLSLALPPIEVFSKQWNQGERNRCLRRLNSFRVVLRFKNVLRFGASA